MPHRKKSDRREPPAPRLPRKRWAAVVIAVMAVAALVTWYWPQGEGATATPLAAARTQADSRFLQPVAMQAAAPATAVTRQARLQQLAGQYELADQTLCQYRESTKYPNASRPIADHPDQVYPNRPIAESRPMRKAQGGSDADVLVQTSQSRVHLAAGEPVTFTIGATDKEGKSLPLFITKATVRGITYQAQRETQQAALNFADDGRNGDAQANDGTFTGVFNPGESGFAQFNGTIRAEVAYSIGDKSGIVTFDVIHSPEVPAVWSGDIRDAVEDGSLVFHLKVDVRTPGRYIATGRIDDAHGKPFALATFNDVLQQGSNDIRLTVFGKLVRDQAPAMPLRLRDVEAYLLKENVDPDRALLPRLEGPVHVSKNYTLKHFSDAEWQSEERTRYLTEFGKDVDLARKALLEADPDQAHRPLPQSECSKKLVASRQ